jgi:hypothetical protein
MTIGGLFHLVAFLFVALFLFYGGAFFYSLVHYRFIKKRSWLDSIAWSLMWMVLYAWIGTIVADIGVAGLKSHPYINEGIMIMISTLPYVAAVRLFIKSKHV